MVDKEKKYYWSDDEEHIKGGPFDTLEQAYSEAYSYRATCFDDPASQDHFYIHYGFQQENPNYDPTMPFDPHDNYSWSLNGETTTKTDALTVTDYFHDRWVKLTAALKVGVDELKKIRDEIPADQEAA